MNSGSHNNVFIAIGGLSGSGKSTVAHHLEQDLISSGYDTVRLSSDEVRKELWGIKMHQTLPEQAYSSEFSDKTYAEIDRRLERALSLGQSVIVDIVFASEEGRAKMQKFADDSGAAFTGIWLDAPETVLKQRVEDRKKVGGDASDAGVNIVDLQLTFNLGKIEWALIDSTQDYQKVYGDVLRLLAENEIVLQPDVNKPPKATYKHEKHSL